MEDWNTIDNYRAEVVEHLKGLGHTDHFIKIVQESFPTIFQDAFDEQLDADLAAITIEEMMDKVVGRGKCRACGEEYNQADLERAVVGLRRGGGERDRAYLVCRVCVQMNPHRLAVLLDQKRKSK